MTGESAVASDTIKTVPMPCLVQLLKVDLKQFSPFQVCVTAKC